MKGQNYIVIALAACACAVGVWLNLEDSFIPASRTTAMSLPELPGKKHTPEAIANDVRPYGEAYTGVVEPGYWAEKFSSTESTLQDGKTRSTMASQEMEIVVPPGARLPLVLQLGSNVVRSDEEPGVPQSANEAGGSQEINTIDPQGIPGPGFVSSITPVQQNQADQIAADFGKEVNDEKDRVRVETGKPQEEAEAQAAWSRAAGRSDERLRTLLGQDRYNREIVKQFRSEIPH